MGKKNRKGNEGLGLVNTPPNARSLREQEIYLSTKGRMLLQSIIKKFSRGTSS